MEDFISNSAHAIAVATPCCPAPVSASMRVLPIRFASNACPRALFILCAPPCKRSSRFRYPRPACIFSKCPRIIHRGGPSSKCPRYPASSFLNRAWHYALLGNAVQLPASTGMTFAPKSFILKTILCLAFEILASHVDGRFHL